jgi:hypothetical protein
MPTARTIGIVNNETTLAVFRCDMNGALDRTRTGSSSGRGHRGKRCGWKKVQWELGV